MRYRLAAAVLLFVGLPVPWARAQAPISASIVPSPQTPAASLPAPVAQAMPAPVQAQLVAVQPASLQLVAVQSIAAAPQPAGVQVIHAGPLGRAVGAFGERLARRGWDTVKVPPIADPIRQVQYTAVSSPSIAMPVAAPQAPAPVYYQALGMPRAPTK